ncbi:glycosyltransferase family 4 protein [Allonocardiopsis opalescens]|uniref:Glycosyltransferase involved in cell wall biosynthesis n=1 Tax=Allonocardiopsis opalescens TaxID=1144618 RepID=A0A2T0QC00_9ACTN|nr:glycosyltransferase family 4 protein [Allonocardiopsis opalescens]PRY01476.1 glycosyltransferase involved in cell wall biosynthesis [Allonocardiopsis opalescens]
MPSSAVRRIALVGPAHPYKGGGAAHTGELAHRLRAAGYDTGIESWRAQYPRMLYPGRQTLGEPDGPAFEPTRRELAWYRPDGWWRRGRALGRAADLVVLSVLTPLQVPPYLGLLAGIGGRAETLALCHNVLPHERRRFDPALMRALLRRVDRVLVHSGEQRAAALRLVPGAQVAAAPLPPHLPAAPPAAPRDGEPLGRLLFFGIVRPYKGLDVLLRALAQVPGVGLTVAGEFWGGTEPVRAQLAELGIADRVELRDGYLPASRLPELFAAADALVLPYRSATASQNAWLGHEHGLPVIASRVGTFPEQIRDGEDGLLVPPGDADALAGAIERFYRPGEPKRMREAVRPVDPGPYWDRYVDAVAAG